MRLSQQRGGRKIEFKYRKNRQKTNQINVWNIHPKTPKHERHNGCSKSRKRPHAAVERNATSFIAGTILTAAKKFGMIVLFFVLWGCMLNSECRQE